MACETVLEKACVEAGEGVVLTYTLSKRTAGGGTLLYSLLIEEIYRGKSEFVFLNDLTDEEEKARELFRLFWEACVTPCTAEDILVDLFYTP